MPISGYCCFITLSVQHDEVSWLVQERQGHCSSQLCWGSFHLPPQTWADPDRFEAWNRSREGGDSSGRWLFGCWQDSRALPGWKACSQSQGGPASSSVCVDFAGWATCRLLAGEGPMFWEQCRDRPLFSYFALWHNQLCLQYTPSPRTWSAFQLKKSQMWKEKGGLGGGECVRSNGSWQHWDGWVTSVLCPLSRVIRSFPPGRGGVGADANLVVSTGCLSLPGRPGDISPTIVIIKKEFTRMII